MFKIITILVIGIIFFQEITPKNLNIIDENIRIYNIINDIKKSNSFIENLLTKTVTDKKIVEETKPISNTDVINNLEKTTNYIRETIQTIKNEISFLQQINFNHMQNDNRKLNSNISNFSIHTKENNVYSFEDLQINAILSIFKELHRKIKDVTHFLSHLPSNVNEIPDKINEIISHFNIAVVVSQIKRDVYYIINNGPNNGELCRSRADYLINNLTISAENVTQNCYTTATVKFNYIKLNFNILQDEAQTLLHDVEKQSLKCLIDSKFSIIKFNNCLEDHYNGFKEIFIGLQGKVAILIDKSLKESNEIINKLAACINNIQLNTIREGQKIIVEIEKCVKFN